MKQRYKDPLRNLTKQMKQAREEDKRPCMNFKKCGRYITGDNRRCYKCIGSTFKNETDQSSQKP